VVAAALSDLAAPVGGTIELPLHLFWSSPDRTFDLGAGWQERAVYEIVLNEARTPADLAAYLNAGRLAALWPGLHLASGVRGAWEDRYPELLALRTAAAAA
jgi:hypothetical protein